MLYGDIFTAHDCALFSVLFCLLINYLKNLISGVASSAELYISALSVLDDPQQLMDVSVLRHDQSCGSSSLVVAATVFTDANSSASDAFTTGCGSSLPTDAWSAESSDVQLLNRLNEALREAESAESSSCILGSSSNHNLPLDPHVIPCLIIYDLPKLLPGAVCLNDSKLKSVGGPVMSSGGGISISLVPSGGGSSNIGGGPTFTTDLKDPDNSDDDYDVQIIGVTPAMSPPKMSYDAACISGIGGTGKVSSPGRDVADPASTSDVGTVVQCIVLQCTAQYVSCFLPTSCGESVFISTAPLSSDARLNEAWQRCGDPASVSDTPAHMFVFNIVVNGGVVMLEDTPSLSTAIADPNDAVMSASLLPTDVGQSDEYDSNGTEQTSAIVAMTRRCDVQIISLADLSVLSVISGDKYRSAIYCSGIDQLCVSTADCKLRFFTIRKSDADASDEIDDDVLMSVVADNATSNADIASNPSCSPPAPVKLSAIRHKLGISFISLVAVLQI